jgi:hypothetical protein
VCVTNTTMRVWIQCNCPTPTRDKQKKSESF